MTKKDKNCDWRNDKWTSSKRWSGSGFHSML